MDAAKDLSAWLKGEKTDSIRLDCMNGLGVYTTTIQVDGKFKKWVQGLPKLGVGSRRFSADEVYDVRIYSLKPMPRTIHAAVFRDGQEIVVDFTKCLDSTMFRFEVSYRMEQEWLQGLVHHRSSPEPLKDALKYHLSAQLTDPNSLSKGFSEVEVEHFPVTAEVQIQEDINTALPITNTLRKVRKYEDKMMKEYDPHHYRDLLYASRERTRLKRAFEKENPSAVLNELSLILRPTKFLSYLSADLDFRLQMCQWGTLMFEALGALSIPKAIEVFTRTDLSLEKPASKGSLRFESGKFNQDLGEIVKKARQADKTARSHE